MYDLTKIYEISKYLDDLFYLQISNDLDILRKNKLELLVELGELANETKCFKYWSKNQSIDKEKILEEYIDCLFMVLCFCNYTGVSLYDKFPNPGDEDIIRTFLNLFQFVNNINEKPNKEEIKRILIEIEYLATLLNFTIDDLERMAKIKGEIIEERFNTDY